MKNKKDIIERFNKLPWIEKYRPVRLSAILLEDKIRNEINKIVHDNDIPNIIITGRPGIGKTTTIRCLAKTVYGKYFNRCVLELNASDDRGIKIEDEITNFCKSVNCIKDEEKEEYPPHKLIILDEADNITDKAQHIISKLMSIYKCGTRFAFTCNTSYNIIETIQSRCKIIRYMKVRPDKIIPRLQDICDLEKAKYSIDAIEYIAELCEGDMRSAINIMELTYRKHKSITLDNTIDVYDRPHIKVLKEILVACYNKDFKKSFELIKYLKKIGHSGTDISSGLFFTLKSKYCDDISTSTKVKMCKEICITTYNISKGLDTDLQLLACITRLCNLDYSKLYYS